ncbi:MAG: DUF3597 family protein [Candidatus Methylacidiphilales bacterium]
MTFNDEQQKYFSFLIEKIIPKLREANQPKLEQALDNLHYNTRKVQAGEIDIATYVKWTKFDCFTIVQAAPESLEGVAFLKEVLGKINDFFGVKLEEADIDALLTEKAKGKKLDWDKSIVDLLKLLDKDSSLSARKKYALALGYPQEEMGKAGSAEFNIWLHSRIKSELAYNEGHWPATLD